MTDGIEINIHPDDADPRSYWTVIPDKYWLYRFAGQAMGGLLANENGCYDYAGCAEDATKHAEALVAELKKDRQAPSGPTEESKPEGATVFQGVGPHRVLVVHDDKQAILSLQIEGAYVVVDAHPPDGPWRVGTARMLEEPA